MSHDYRPGDVLRLECPFTETTVTGVSRCHVVVRCPWLAVDPQAEGYRWNGERALPLPEAHEWEVFRTEPPESGLAVGDACLVGIPATVVHVGSVAHYDPPLVTGLLPRPACYLDVLPQGEEYDPELEDQCYALDPADGEPVRIDLLFRPYAFLEPGDELADRDGRAWRFDAAWEWHAFDGGQSGAPVWPLTLLARGGAPAGTSAGLPEALSEGLSEGAVAVARATAVGSHEQERERWAGLALARPASDNR
ncbi:hypothetical protein ACFV0O_04820 [Kitasatospora sp. NPDC059577]|uniref:hypothetical protein n=1 Tax=Kitasatospora sp. NPDC059577 TaxID=3346873 RepID=UPI0036A1937B